jgi:hypothetical protein
LNVYDISFHNVPATPLNPRVIPGLDSPRSTTPCNHPRGKRVYLGP